MGEILIVFKVLTVDFRRDPYLRALTLFSELKLVRS